MVAEMVALRVVSSSSASCLVALSTASRFTSTWRRIMEYVVNAGMGTASFSSALSLTTASMYTSRSPGACGAPNNRVLGGAVLPSARTGSWTWPLVQKGPYALASAPGTRGAGCACFDVPSHALRCLRNSSSDCSHLSSWAFSDFWEGIFFFFLFVLVPFLTGIVHSGEETERKTQRTS